MLFVLVVIACVGLLIFALVNERDHKKNEEIRKQLGLRGLDSLKDDPDRRKEIADRRFKR